MGPIKASPNIPLQPSRISPNGKYEGFVKAKSHSLGHQRQLQTQTPQAPDASPIHRRKPAASSSRVCGLLLGSLRPPWVTQAERACSCL